MKRVSCYVNKRRPLFILWWKYLLRTVLRQFGHGQQVFKFLVFYKKYFFYSVGKCVNCVFYIVLHLCMQVTMVTYKRERDNTCMQGSNSFFIRVAKLRVICMYNFKVTCLITCLVLY